MSIFFVFVLFASSLSVAKPAQSQSLWPSEFMRTYTNTNTNYPNFKIDYPVNDPDPSNTVWGSPSGKPTFHGCCIDSYFFLDAISKIGSFQQPALITLTVTPKNQLGVNNVDDVIKLFRDGGRWRLDNNEPIKITNILEDQRYTQHGQPARETAYIHIHTNANFCAPYNSSPECAFATYHSATIYNNWVYVISMETFAPYIDGKLDTSHFHNIDPIAKQMAHSLRVGTTSPPPPPASYPRRAGFDLWVRDLQKNTNYPIRDEWINTLPSSRQSLYNVRISCTPLSEFSSSKATPSECLSKPDNIHQVKIGLGSNCAESRGNCSFEYGDKIFTRSSICASSQSCPWWIAQTNHWSLTVFFSKGNNEKMPVSFQLKAGRDLSLGGRYDLKLFEACDLSTGLCSVPQSFTNKYPSLSQQPRQQPQAPLTSSPTQLGGTNNEAQQTQTIEIGPYSYKPSGSEVTIGTTVTWINNDSKLHLVTSGSGPDDSNSGKIFDSSNLAPGRSFSTKLNTPGIFNYYDKLYPTMRGMITVK